MGRLSCQESALRDVQEALFYDEDDMRAVFDRSLYLTSLDPKSDVCLASLPFTHCAEFKEALDDIIAVLEDESLVEAHADCHHRAATIFAAREIFSVFITRTLTHVGALIFLVANVCR